MAGSAAKEKPKETFYFRCSAYSATNTHTHTLPLSSFLCGSLSLSLSVSLIFSRKTTLICGAHGPDPAITHAISQDYAPLGPMPISISLYNLRLCLCFLLLRQNFPSLSLCGALLSLLGGFSFSGFAFKLFCWNFSCKFFLWFRFLLDLNLRLSIALKSLCRLCVCVSVCVRVCGLCVPHVLHVVLKFCAQQTESQFNFIWFTKRQQ